MYKVYVKLTFDDGNKQEGWLAEHPVLYSLRWQGSRFSLSEAAVVLEQLEEKFVMSKIQEVRLIHVPEPGVPAQTKE
jgi:hypothetical protein